MPPSQNNRLIAFILLLKDEWLPAQRNRFNEWYFECRQEPILFWETPKVRYGTYALGGITALWIITWLIGSFDPVPTDARPRATTAGYHVTCGRNDCGHHFLIDRKFGFDDFPVVCPQCHKETGQQSMRCLSSKCKGKYVLPAEREGKKVCRECGAAARVAG